MKENLSFGEKEKKENTRGNNLESFKIKAVRAAKKALIMASILGGSNTLASPKEKADNAFFDSKKESVELTQEDMKVCEGEFSHFLEEFDNELEGGKESKTNKKEKIKSKPMFENVDENNFTHEYWTSGYVPQEKLRKYIGNHPELYKKIIDGEIKMPERSLLTVKKMLGPIIPAILKYAEDHDFKPRFNTDTYLKEYANTPTRYTTNLYIGDRKVAGLRSTSGASLDTNWSYESSYGASLNDVSTHEILGHGKSSERGGSISGESRNGPKEEADAEGFLSSYKSSEGGKMEVRYDAYGFPEISTDTPPIFQLKEMHTYFKQWIEGVTGIQEKEKIENIYSHFVKEGGFKKSLLKYAYDINNIKNEDVDRFFANVEEVKNLYYKIENKYNKLYEKIRSEKISDLDWQKAKMDIAKNSKYAEDIKSIFDSTKELNIKIESIKKFQKEIMGKSPYEDRKKTNEVNKQYLFGGFYNERSAYDTEAGVFNEVVKEINKIREEKREKYSLEKRFPETKQVMTGYKNFERQFFTPDSKIQDIKKIKEKRKELIPINSILEELAMLTYKDTKQTYKEKKWSPKEYYKEAVEIAFSKGIKKEDIEKQIPYYMLDFILLKEKKEGEKGNVIGVQYKIKEGQELFYAEQEFKKEQLKKAEELKEK